MKEKEVEHKLIVPMYGQLFEAKKPFLAFNSNMFIKLNEQWTRSTKEKNHGVNAHIAVTCT